MSDFIGVVRAVSRRRDELPAPRRPALPPAEPEALHAEPDDDEGDREALEAYGREN